MRIALLLAFLLTIPAFAHAQRGSEAGSQSSQMAPSSGNTGGANNGTGTTGSPSHDAGSARSKATPSTIKTDGSNRGGSGAKENDPALGGGTQSK
jgi:hypothetical protein